MLPQTAVLPAPTVVVEEVAVAGLEVEMVVLEVMEVMQVLEGVVEVKLKTAGASSEVTGVTVLLDPIIFTPFLLSLLLQVCPAGKEAVAAVLLVAERLSALEALVQQLRMGLISL